MTFFILWYLFSKYFERRLYEVLQIFANILRKQKMNKNGDLFSQAAK